MSQERCSFENSLGQKLAAVIHWPASRGGDLRAVVLCHGMESSKDGAKHVALAGRLASRGILALRFDFSFAGESDGRFEDITFTQEVDDLATAVSFVRSLGVQRMGLFGSSMGGAVAILHAGRDPAVGCVVTLAAVAHPGALARHFIARDRVGPEDLLALGTGRHVKGIFFLDAMTQDVIGAARKIRAPCLVIHGKRDEIVPVSDARDLHEALEGPKRLQLLEEGDHVISDAVLLEGVLDQTIDWFTIHLTDGPNLEDDKIS